MESLKPCPFCGADAQIGDTLNGQMVFCVNPRCGAYLEDYFRWNGNEYELLITAKEKWNKRGDNG